MKAKDTTGYPHRGYPPAAECNWLKEAFSPEYLEKNPPSQITID